MLDLQVDGRSYPAVVKELQRHPIKRTVNHIDFLQVNMNEEITVSVPLRLEGEAKAVLAEGGLVDPAVDTIEVTTTPNNMPNEFVIDITDMQPGDVIRLGDVPMPNGVTATGDPDMPVVTILVMRASELETDAVPRPRARAAEAPRVARPPPRATRRRRGRRRLIRGDRARRTRRRAGQPRQGVRPHPAQRR